MLDLMLVPLIAVGMLVLPFGRVGPQALSSGRSTFSTKASSMLEILPDGQGRTDRQSQRVRIKIPQDYVVPVSPAPLVSYRIDLSNPGDSLFIDVSEQILGNLHRIVIQEDSGGEMLNKRGLFTLIVLSDPEVRRLTFEQACDIAWGEETDIKVAKLVLVNQGRKDAMERFRASEHSCPHRNDLNVNAVITANREFASQSRVFL
ncbi:MAG: hypothetical protein WA782_08275 [Sulfitobacter sp.]